MMLGSCFLAACLLLFTAEEALAELRWCKVSNASSTLTGDGWLRYDDEQLACISCSEQSTSVLNKKEIEDHQCCGGWLTENETCENGVGDSNGKTCSNARQCDGVKQCVNGSDEMGCDKCGPNHFTCPLPDRISDNNTADLCISPSKVCDSVKDCPTGEDELGCPWHGGWCDGFLCGAPHQRCIPQSQVCDGVKQCVDGSDEYNCLYCAKQFRCFTYERDEDDAPSISTTTAQCVGSFRVCDGTRDCDNGLDESNCYRWKEWSGWSACHPPTTCMKTRRRSCIDGRTMNEVDPQLCYEVVDEHQVLDVPSVENQTAICSLCIPTRSPHMRPTAAPTHGAEVASDLATFRNLIVSQQNGNDELDADRLIDFSDDLQPTRPRPTSTVPDIDSLINASQPNSSSSTHNSLPATFSTFSNLGTANHIATDQPRSEPATFESSHGITSSLSHDTPFTSVADTSDVASSSASNEMAEDKNVIQATSLSSAIEKIAEMTSETKAERYPTAAGTMDILFQAFPKMRPSITGDIENDTTSTTIGPPRSKPSFLPLILIVVGTASFALVLVTLICVLACCCSERRHKHGKLKLTKRFRAYRSDPPRYYHDVQLPGEASNPPPGERETSHAFTPLPRTTPVSLADSGVDDVNSTLSRDSHVSTFTAGRR